SLAVAREIGIEEHAARAYTNLAATAVETRQLALARKRLQEGLHYCSERGLDAWSSYMSGWLAVCALAEGRWDEAASVAARMVKEPGLAVPIRIQPLVVLGRIRARQGEGGVGDPLQEALELAAETGELQRIGPVRAARAEVAWLAGDLASAAREA